MAASVDELKTTMQAMAKQFAGFQDMMSTALDKLGVLETWKETADGSLGTLLQKSTVMATRVVETTSRVSRLEFRPPPPLPRRHLTGVRNIIRHQLRSGARNTIRHQLRRVSTSTPFPEHRQMRRLRDRTHPWGTVMTIKFGMLAVESSDFPHLARATRRGRIAEWERLYELVMAKFDKDQYKVLLRQFNALKQIASVLEYQAAFEKLAHGVLLYNPAGVFGCLGNVDDESEDESAVEEQEVLAIQTEPNTRVALKLLAQIGKHKVLILVDSGSIGTFVSEQLVSHLKLKATACEPTTYKAADGGLMLCDQKLLSAANESKEHSTVSAEEIPQCAPSTEIQAISECIPTWIQKLKEGYEEDDQAKQLIMELAVSPKAHPDYTLKEGVLRYKGRVWVGNNTTAQQHILIAMHDSGIGGHSGISATYARIKQLFAWPNMKQPVQEFVKQCQIVYGLCPMVLTSVLDRRRVASFKLKDCNNARPRAPPSSLRHLLPRLFLPPYARPPPPPLPPFTTDGWRLLPPRHPPTSRPLSLDLALP
ncbi:unnamed protein product [Miscanthus lutarioriparius]|uniref:Integrase zinc-binding domain-containing protein n=1 Tax=Miscanthus lutarioriparius TaxID=422564 RepID=A0A811PJP6_9POAL|nr:unnamed protein product [Miscanthus lutarioriparius]